MEQLTNQEIAKVFSMYFGCKYIADDESEKIVSGVAINAIHQGRNKQNRKLILTPLDRISDEDARGLTILIRKSGVFNYSSFLCALKNRLKNNIIKYPVELQYLISKGYAVPLFFSPGHWANGKTAIELAIAIESK